MSGGDNDGLLEPEVPEPESTDWKTKAKETMKLWNEKYCLWKNFDESQIDLVKWYVGLLQFGKPETDEESNSESEQSTIQTLYDKYDSKKKAKIDEIVGQFQFENGQLNLSHTLLYLSFKDLQICLFRQMKFNGEVNFIDFNGRVYTSWQHFVETNKLPKCEYMAPANGIHDIMTDEVEVHKTPVSSTIGTALDWLAMGATLTALGLVSFAAAPVTAGFLGAGGTAYGVGQSVYDLRDRQTHKQSIAPTNLENVTSYLNIGTGFICGASSALSATGKYVNIASWFVKGVNYTARATIVTNFGLHVFILQRKVRDGEASYGDLLGLCVDIFLMYGMVSDVVEMRSSLSTLEPTPATPPKGLSKGARRRWRKSQAKLNGSVASANGNVTKAGAWDSTLFRGGIGIAGIVFEKLLRHHCPAIHEIYQNICLIIEDFENFCLERTSPQCFYSNIVAHCHNLYKLLQNNAREIKETVMGFFQSRGIVASPRSIGEISNIIDDGVIAINYPNEFEDESLEDDSASELSPKTDAVYKMILDVVKDRVCRKEKIPPENVLSTFTEELASVVNEIKTKINQEYDVMLSFNIRSFGEKKAKEILSGIGINSKNDFANTIIEKTIESLKSTDRFDVLIPVEKQLDELFSLYEELFRSMTVENDTSSFGALETCEILHKSIELIVQPISTIYTKSKEIFEINVKYFGPKNAMIFVTEAMDLDNSSAANFDDFSDSTFLGLAIKNFNLDENKSKLLPIHEEISQEPISEIASFTDEFKMETLLNLCDFYVQRIGFNEKNLVKIYSFVTDKFTNQFQSLASQENPNADVKEKLKLNSNYFSKNNFNQLNRFLHETNILEIFNRVVEMFKKEDFAIALIAEYYKTMHGVTDFHAEYLKHLVADDGVTMYTMVIENRDVEDEFKEQAEKLFRLNKNQLDVVRKDDNLIVLKNNDDNKYVVFQFVKNENEALVMQVDLAKKNDENE